MNEDADKRKSKLKYSKSKVDVTLEEEKTIDNSFTSEEECDSSNENLGELNLLESNETDSHLAEVVTKKMHGAGNKKEYSIASHIKFYSLSDCGFVRKTNEDYYGCVDLGDTKLFTIVDGMGGPDKGEVASKMVVDTMVEIVGNKKNISVTDVTSGVLLANRKIVDLISEKPHMAGMGGTVTSALFAYDSLYLCHIGNCRLYRYDTEKQLTRLTVDHTLEEEMNQVDEWGFNLNENGTHMLTRSIGGSLDIDIDWNQVDVDPRLGETYILATDGFFDCMTSDEIVQILEARTSESAIRDFREIFIKRGGKDNMTAFLIRIGEEAEVKEDSEIDIVAKIFKDRPNSGSISSSLSNLAPGKKKEDEFNFDITGFGDIDSQSDEDFLNDLVKKVEIGKSKLDPAERRRKRRAKRRSEKLNDELEERGDIKQISTRTQLPNSSLKSKEEIRAALLANDNRQYEKNPRRNSFGQSHKSGPIFPSNNRSLGSSLLLLLIGALIGGMISRYYFASAPYDANRAAMVEKINKMNPDQILGAYRTNGSDGSIRYVVVATRDVLAELNDEEDGVVAKQALLKYFEAGEFVKSEQDLLQKVAMLKSPSSQELLVDIVQTLAKVYDKGDKRIEELARQNAMTTRILEKLVKQLDYLTIIRVKDET